MVWVPDELIIPSVQNGKLLSAGVYRFMGVDEEYRQAEDEARERLKHRDWRTLREHLLKLNIADQSSVAEWLNAAGYAPSPSRASWRSVDVTSELAEALARHRDVFAWMLQLEVSAFRHAVKAAVDWFDEKRAVRGVQLEAAATSLETPIPRLKDPENDFYRRTSAPWALSFTLLQIFLQGTGQAPVWLAEFRWDREGVPSVQVQGNTPLEVIGLSIHIDRNFSARQWAFCAKCGGAFERGRGNERFCSPRCRNYVLTNARRKKLGLLKDAQDAWTALTVGERKGHEHWSWVAAHVNNLSKGEFDINPAWAKHQHQLTAKRKK